MGSSPAKKLDFAQVDANGNEKAVPLVGLPELSKPADAVEEAKNAVAPTLKPSEASEPLLRENPNRFVLFPIKYNEVRFLTRLGLDAVSSCPCVLMLACRYGRCTRRPRPRSGRQKR